MRVRCVSTSCAVCLSTMLAALAAPLLAQTAVGTAFVYQGSLQDPNGPANGSFAMQFKLYDAAATPPGVQIGPTLTFDGAGGNPPAISVADGLFSVGLDFGAGVFDGNERWLQVMVSGTTLTPRQPVKAAPYAVHAAGATSLDLPFSKNVTVPSGTYLFSLSADNSAGYGAVISAANGSQAADAIAIKAVGGSLLNNLTYAVYGWNFGYVGAGVYGLVDANSCSPIGVQGLASGTSAANFGVHGQSNSTGGTGVYGLANAASGTNYGVRGKSNSASGYAGYFEGRGYFSGRLGLGVAAPAEALDVSGTAQMTGFKLPTGAAAGRVLTTDATGVGTWQVAPASQWTSSGNDIYYTTGNVGIGTAAPDAQLTIDGTNSTATGLAVVAPGGATGRIDFSSPSGDPGIVGRADNGHRRDIRFDEASLVLGVSDTSGGPSTSQSLTITEAGRLGIGTAAPAAKLHVAGDLRVDGAITQPTQTGYVAVPPVAWRTNNNDISAYELNIVSSATIGTYLGFRGVHSPPQYAYYAPVDLPDGATVTELTALMQFGTSAIYEFPIIQLWRAPLLADSPAELLASRSTPDCATYPPDHRCTFTTSTISNAVIDNSQYSYYLALSSTTGPGSDDFRIWGTRITYTAP